jgi:YVTN family beta-propeller protein
VTRRVALLLIAGLLAACSAAPSGSPSATTSASASSSSSEPTPSGSSGPALPTSQDIDEAGGLHIAGTPSPDWVILAGDSAWVAGVGAGIGRYDRHTGEVLPEVALTGEICLAMGAGFGSVWLGNCTTRQIVRIDEDTGEIVATTERIPEGIQGESSIAVGEDGVWFLTFSANPKLIKIDPTTNAVAASFEAPQFSRSVRAGFGVLWVTNTNGNVARINPADGSVVAVIPTGPIADFLAVGEDAVWVQNNGDGTVSRVDPATNAVAATIRVSGRPIQGGDIAVGGGSVWARVSDVLVAQIDPATNAVVARFGESWGSGSVAADDAAVWISAHDILSIWRLPLP